MVDDQVYFLNAGVHQQNVYQGNEEPIEIMVVKGGTGNQSGTLQMAVEESLLEKFGDKKYSLLPAQYYKLKFTTLAFKKSDNRLPFEIEMDAVGIEALQKETDLKYAIPLSLTTSGGLKLSDEESGYTIIVPKVMKPYLQFKTPGLSPSTVNISLASSANETLSYVFLKTNYHNQIDLTYSIQLDTIALNVYNQTNGTSHKLFPASNYRLDEATFKLQQLNNEGALTLHVLKDNLKKGSYLLPLTITKVGKFGINPEAATTLVPISIQN